jgi:flagellar basal-body rod protein FlgG
MDPILSLTLHSMHDDLARLEKIGMNLTNAATPGYKRSVDVVRPFGALVDRATTSVAAAELGTDSVSDFAPGSLRQSGGRLDVALAGDGFFEIATEQGPAYTREGDMRVDARGRLVTATGQPVMGIGGEIVLTTAEPTIDGAGRVTEQSAGGPRLIGQLKVVRFDPHARLERLGDGLFAGGAGMTVLGETDVKVRQGYLENSNVSSVHEMVQMMQTMRHFESMQRATQGYDEMVGTAIRKLGEA